MQKPENYDQEEAFTGEFKSINPGGHICKIMGSKIDTTTTGKEVLIIRFDVTEGPAKDFYSEQFDRKILTNKDAKWQGVYRQLTEGTSLKFFKGMITAIENSNSGYKWNWDETTLKGKLFGGVFGQEEFIGQDGQIHLATKCRFIRSVEQIRKGVEIPEIKRINKSDAAAAFGGHDVAPDEEIPF